MSFVVGLYEDFFWRPRDNIKKKNGTSEEKKILSQFLILSRAKMFTIQISSNLTSQMITTRVVITTKYSMTQSCFERFALLHSKPWIPLGYHVLYKKINGMFYRVFFLLILHHKTSL